MPRIRTIKPEFWQSESLSDCGVEAHMFAAGLLNYCDDEGFFECSERKLGIVIFPLHEHYRSPTVVLHTLSQLSDAGFLKLYLGSDGKKYGHVTNFQQNQVINKPTSSKIKGLINEEFEIREDYRSDTGVLPTGKEQGKEQGKERIPPYSPPEKKSVQKKSQFEIPDGINPQAWVDFEDMRKKIKKPLTDRAKQLIIIELQKINQSHSQDPNDILNQSTMNCWQSVYPLKINQKGNQYGKKSTTDTLREQAENFDRWLDENGVTDSV